MLKRMLIKRNTFDTKKVYFLYRSLLEGGERRSRANAVAGAVALGYNGSIRN